MKRTWGQQFKSALAGMLLGILVPSMAVGPVFAQATLLPNAKQQYLNDAADPVASGHVDYYIPNTLTRKTVWSDAAKTTPLPNPVLLDAAGRPQPTGQIFGDGSYRQRVVDQDGITIWDAVTTSTGSSSGGAVAASEGVMVGTIIPWANTTLPAKYLYTAGQAVNRVTYASLLTAITYQLTALCQVGVATITVPTIVSDAVPLGAPVEFSCFAPGTTVLAKASGSLTMSSNATATTSVTGRILPWGNGDGSLTFNVPDLRGRTLVGRNNMDSSISATLSSLYYLADPNAVNARGGSPSSTLLASNIPNGVAATGNNAISVTSTPTNVVQGSIVSSNAVGGATGQLSSPTNPNVSTAIASTNPAQAITVVTSGGGGIAASATVGAGGAGYTAGTQLLTVSGGTCTTQPQFNVTIAAGAITAPVLVTPGLCSVVPANPAATTGGGGAGGTLNLAYTAAPISIVQPSVTADYVIKALPDDSPSTPGVASLGGMTGAIACGTSIVCSANTISVSLAAASVTNTMLAQMPPSTVKMNPTASTASPVDATIDSLVALPVPDPNLDFLFIHDNATNQIKKVNPSQLVTGLGAGVTSLDGVAGAIGVGTGSADVIGSTLTTNVFASRTYAATLDLTAYSAIRTLGYTTAGDGGEATFQKTAGNFIDTRILTNAITNNGTSGCTNGTYFGVPFSGGSGRGAYGVVTVAGNVVTAISLGGQSTAGYIAGNVLNASPNIAGCSTTVTTTVSTVTTPTGSFTDAGGNKWQIVFPTDGLNIKAMGVVFDWDGSDGTATDNFTTIQNALSFASYPTSTIVDLGGSLGGQVNLPKNTAMFCGGGTAALVVPYGVKVKGQGNYTTVLKPCDTWGVSVNVIELCDKNTRLAGFGCMLEDFQVFMQRDVSANANVSLIYSNNAQHDAGMRRMVLYPGACRRGLTYENGYGGATLVTFENLEFKGGKAAASCGGNANPMISINVGTTWVYFTNLNMGGLSASFSGPRDNGLVITGGFVVLEGIHPEQIVSPVTINIAGGLSNGMVRARMVTGGVDCVGMFSLAVTNTLGNFMLGPPMAVNGCVRLVTNGQPAGANLTGPVMVDTIFNP